MLKNNWQTKKLKDVCEFQRGLTYSKNDEVVFSNNIVLRANNVDMLSNTLDFSDLKYISDTINIPDNKIVKRGSLLICTASGSKSHLGKIAYIDQDFKMAFGGFMGQVTPKKEISSKYLYYIFISDGYKKLVGGISAGANINNLKFSDLESYLVQVPPLDEQHRIVKILDEVFEKVAKAKENAEKNLQNAKGLFEAYLQSVFNIHGEEWNEERFDEVCILQRGFDLPTHSRNEGDYPLVSSNGVTDRIDLWKVKSPGVVTGRSGTIGSVHFIEEDFWPLNTALYIKNFHGNDERFIYYFLKQFNLGKYSTGAGVPTLNRNNVHCEMVAIPSSIKEQKSIVAKLDALAVETKKLEAIYKQKIARLEELKKSVLKKAFNGEL